jgi:hypothetical protein
MKRKNPQCRNCTGDLTETGCLSQRFITQNGGAVAGLDLIVQPEKGLKVAKKKQSVYKILI